MKKVKLKKALLLVFVAAGLFMANYPLVKSMGQSMGTNGNTAVSNAGPGGGDCWVVFLRNGNISARVCIVTVNGIDEKCKIVTDLSYYEILDTCVPVPPPH